MKIMAVVLGRISSQMRDGGSIRFVEVFRRLATRDVKLGCILSKNDHEIFQRYGINAEYRLVSDGKSSEGSSIFYLVWIYTKRIIRALEITVPKEIDIVYAHSDFFYDVLPAIVFKKRKKVKLVVCLFLLLRKPKFGEVFSNIRGFCYFIAQRMSLFLINRYADLVLVLNRLDKEYLEETGFKPRVKVVSMGVERVLDAKGVNKRYEGVFIGRFHPQKGIMDLIKIWEYICNKKPNAKLAIIGSGDKWWRRKLEKEIIKRGLSLDIDLLGYKEGNDKFSILKSSKVFLFPSHYESWGMVVAEAMACGLPVVAYDLDIFKDIFYEGIKTVPLGNIERFAEGVLKFLGDDKLYQSASKQAREFISKYDWDIVAERDLKILEDLLYEKV